MIPRVVHYCWFGGNPFPKKIVRCMKSWKKHLPDYEFRLWNEENFDVNAYPFAKEAYRAKNWAFVADICRLHALVACGGIYLDADVEVVRPLDDLLSLRAFIGFDGETYPEMETLGAEKGFPIFREMLDHCAGRELFLEDGRMDTAPLPHSVTPVLLRHGFRADGSAQEIDGLTVFPGDYFSPMAFDSGKVKGTENTYTVHHYAGTWLDPKEIRRIRRGRMLCSVFGERAGWRIHRRIASFGRLYGNLRRNIRKDGLFGGLAKTRRGRRAWRREHPRRR
ncbi:MAG: glycosyl transferase [Clostridiales bacterium]|nr:glycosyl transferase [Clostridiales bacterium]